MQRTEDNDIEQGEDEVSDHTAPPGGNAAPQRHDGYPEIGTIDPSRTSEPSNKPAQDFDDSADDLWSLYGKEAKRNDEEWIKVLKEDMDAILIFAGLFSAILTAFVVPKIQDLKVNPADQSAFYQNQTAFMLGRMSQQLASVVPQLSASYTPYPPFHASASDRRVNILWLISLVCSLTAALLATLVQQWARAFMRVSQQSRNPLKAARIRVFLFEGAKRLPSIAEFVPGLIHISLILFFWGLGDIILHIDKAVFIATVVPILVCVFLYLLCVFLPMWNLQWPYWTPFSPCIWYLIQILRNLLPSSLIWSLLTACREFSFVRRVSPYYNYMRTRLVNIVQTFRVANMEKHREQSVMEQTEGCKNRDVYAVQWLINNINGNNEMQAFVLAISGSLNQHWGRRVWKTVVNGDLPTSLEGQPRPGLSSIQMGTTNYRLCRCVRNFFESESEGDFMESKVQRTRMRGCIETAASLVCCADVQLDSFGEVAEVLSKMGAKEQTNNSLSIRLNPLFSVRWTCLSLVAINQIIGEGLQQLANTALDGIALFQINPILGSRDTVTMALRAAQKMDDDLKKAWEAVLDLRYALGPWIQNENTPESEIRSILNQDTCKESIQGLERIAMDTVGLKEIDLRIRFLQATMGDITHELTRCLPGVFFDEWHSAAPTTTDLPSVQTTPIPQLIFPGQQLQNMTILGQRLRDIAERENTEWDEETRKSLKYLREVPIPLCGLNYLVERQLWRLLDLRDGGGLGFTIELFFLVLKQLLSASPSPDEPSSSELKKAFYTGTFDVIKSNWKTSKDLAGTQRILLDLLCDLIIQGRGIFSDFRYPWYIVKMLLDLVGEMVKGLGRSPHIDDLLDELMDDSLRYRMNIDLRDKVWRIIQQPLDTVS